MQKIGVIGMGIMGAPMAVNLVKAGFDVTVFNRDAKKSKPVQEAGAAVAGSIGELAAACEAVVVVVSDDDAVRAVCLGEDGIEAAGREGLLVIDASTALPDTTIEVAAALRARGMVYLDAPVTGSKPQAESGTLFFLAAGDKAGYQRAVPLFEAMGRRHIYLGENGMGTCAKLCNNLCGFINLAAFSEALAIGSKYGLEPELLCEVIGDSGGRSAAMEGKWPKMLERDWSPQFALPLAAKDMRLAQELSEKVGVDARIIATAMEVYAEATPGGEGKDFCSLIEWYER
jgi:3-hydroxyisobutyrate dehydrogenase-like beta-hydroxyacid dehydrogenase